MVNEPITPSQCAAARDLLGWSREALARVSGIAEEMIADFETGARTLPRNDVITLRWTLEEAGIRFGETAGESPHRA